MDWTKVCKLSGLPDNVIPNTIEPMSMRMDVRLGDNQKSMVIQRTQFPITGRQLSKESGLHHSIEPKRMISEFDLCI